MGTGAGELCSQGQESARPSERPGGPAPGRRPGQLLGFPAAALALLLLLAVAHVHHCLRALHLRLCPMFTALPHRRGCQPWLQRRTWAGASAAEEAEQAPCPQAESSLWTRGGATASGAFLGRTWMAQAPWLGRGQRASSSSRFPRRTQNLILTTRIPSLVYSFPSRAFDLQPDKGSCSSPVWGSVVWSIGQCTQRLQVPRPVKAQPRFHVGSPVGAHLGGN